jgi:8-oxo-dGTP pyrophosphatase MutT (NUDIX family)
MDKQPVDQKHRGRIRKRAVEHRNLIAAGALIYCKTTHRYLFVLRDGKSYNSNWGLVGGKIESDEHVINGLMREINEEIGLDYTDKKVIPIETFTSDDGKFFYHTYLIPVEHEFIPTLNEEHKGYAWVNLNDHPRPLHPGVWRTFNFRVVIDKIQTLEKIL